MLKSASSFRFVLFALLVGLVFLAGCGPNVLDSVPEEEERSFRRGEQLQREGREAEALSAYLAVIAKREDAPQSHLQAGLLYLDHLEDPISAIYHFRRYLALARPANGENAPPQVGLVEQRIEAARKLFARQLPGDPFRNRTERLDLLDLIEQLKRENAELKQRLATVSQQVERLRAGQVAPSAGPAVRTLPGEDVGAPAPPPPAPEPQRNQPRTIEVRSGDTLSEISRRAYGTPGRWMDIFQANRDQLDNPNDLRPGQTLRVP